jgi:hypothetical protein
MWWSCELVRWECQGKFIRVLVLWMVIDTQKVCHFRWGNFCYTVKLWNRCSKKYFFTFDPDGHSVVKQCVTAGEIWYANTQTMCYSRWNLVCKYTNNVWQQVKFGTQIHKHQHTFLIIKPTGCTNFSNLFLEWNSTSFGQFLCPSSGVFHCTHSNGTCRTGLLTAC